MTTYDQAIKHGRWLIARRKWLLPTLAIATLTALLISTPFRLIHHSVWLTAGAVLLASAGLFLHGLSSVVVLERRANNESRAVELTDFIDAAGVYSMMRFPGYTSIMLLILSLVLYTGAIWYIIASIMICYISVYCIVLAQEHIMQARYGDTFTQWCKSTYPLTPWILNYQPWRVKIKPLKIAASQSRLAVAMTAGFCLINLLKNYLVDYDLMIDFPWLAIFGIVTVLSLMLRLFAKKLL